MNYRFSEYLLDVDRRLLFRSKEEVHISPKAFRLLQVLLESRPKAVSKNELHEVLWPATFVSESNLATLALELRTALEDDAKQPQFLRTVYGYGYAFCAEAREEAGTKSTPSSGAARLAYDGRDIPLFSGENVIGRDPDVAIPVDNSTVSRHHARLLVGEDAVTLEDLDSKNGTFINGQRISAPTVVTDGDQVAVGEVRMTFRLRPSDESTRTMGPVPAKT